MKIVFLSHSPHEVHLEFAKSVNAEIEIVNLNWLVKLAKRIPLLGYLYPFISFFYSLFTKINCDILLVDGASSLYLAAFLKVKNPGIKIVLINGDLFFYKLKMRNFFSRNLMAFFYNKIDFILSVSKQSEEMASKFVKVPMEITPPYANVLKKIKVKRKNWGLYVGRLDPDKNIKRIIKFGVQCPYFDKFIIIGEGAYNNYIKNLSKENNKLVYVGQRKDVNRFYSECKFLIHIPDYDPHPCTTMEAALCGCFPIMSKGVGSKYLFDKRFVINNPQDFAAINNQILYILKNETQMRKLLGKITKNFLTKSESIENFKDKFHSIINKNE